MKRLTKRVFMPAVALMFTMLFLVALIDWYMAFDSESAIYASITDLPDTNIALVLGTSKFVGKRRNLFYQHRIDAVVDLYFSGKVHAILISGDNATRYYNEPITMQKDLQQRGIPISAITLDYAGFRTLDSVVRAKQVFGLDRLVIVSQRFHLERAIYIAKHSGLNALGYIAQDAPAPWYWRVRIREALARFKAWIDIYILDMQPKFLGEKIEVQLPIKMAPQPELADDTKIVIPYRLGMHP